MKEIPILYSTPMIQAKLAGRKTQTRRVKGLEGVNSHEGEPLKLIGDSRTVQLPRPAIKYDDRIWFWFVEGSGTSSYDKMYAVRCPYKPGDLLWARETWRPTLKGTETPPGYWNMFSFKAGGDNLLCPLRYDYDFDKLLINGKWKPSIHMPKIAARIWDRVVSIRVERLQDISEEDAIAEGIEVDEWTWGPIAFPDGTIDRSVVGKKTKWFRDYNKPGEKHWNNDGAVKSYKTLWESINGADSWDLNPWVWVVTTENVSLTGKP